MRTLYSLSCDASPNLTRELGIPDLAKVLFASSLQESDQPSHELVRAAILDTLRACGGDCRPCAACVAQEAGDHPEAYVRRMRWSLRTVENAYAPAGLVAA